jgi:hypothetical protein
MMEKNWVDKVPKWLVLLRWVYKIVVDEGYLETRVSYSSMSRKGL